MVGSVEAGKLADLVLWKPAFFGVKPELVMKGGMIAWRAMGDANASIPTPQPVLYRPDVRRLRARAALDLLTFVSRGRAGRRRAGAARLARTARGRGGLPHASASAT